MSNPLLSKLLKPESGLSLWITSVLVLIVVFYNPILGACGVIALIYLLFHNWQSNRQIQKKMQKYIEESLLPLSAFLEQVYTNHHDLYYAGATLYLIPAIFIFLKGEKYLEKGFSMGESDL